MKQSTNIHVTHFKCVTYNSVMSYLIYIYIIIYQWGFNIYSYKNILIKVGDSCFYRTLSLNPYKIDDRESSYDSASTSG